MFVTCSGVSVTCVVFFFIRKKNQVWLLDLAARALCLMESDGSRVEDGLLHLTVPLGSGQHVALPPPWELGLRLAPQRSHLTSAFWGLSGSVPPFSDPVSPWKLPRWPQISLISSPPNWSTLLSTPPDCSLFFWVLSSDSGTWAGLLFCQWNLEL